MKKLINYKVLVCWIVLLFPVVSVAELIECPQRTITQVLVQGDRDDNFPFANKLLVKFDEPCNEVVYGFVENTHQSYNGLLSLALTAFTTDNKVALYLNSSKSSGPANELAIIVMYK